MPTQIEREIHLVNAVSENIAEFLLLGSTDNNYKWVKAVPLFGMHEMYRMNAANPIGLPAGMIMPAESFLGYIATVIRNPARERAGYEYVMRAMGEPYASIVLRKGMSVKEIALLTGWDIEKIREFYKDYFVVDCN